MSNAIRNIESGLYPLSAKDAVERWDKGETVWSVEMGGLGPGYEQAIQAAAIELMRKLCDKDLPENKDELNKLFDYALHDVNREIELGLSGAQAGAAKNIAYIFITQGWEAMDKVERDRHIQVSKDFP